jgi:hypothetical protein
VVKYPYMAKRKSKKRDAENSRALIKWVSAILLIALGMILLLGAFGLAGIAGQAIFGFAFGTIGVGAFLLPVVIILLGVAIMLERMLISPLTSAGIAIIVLSTLTLLGILTQNLEQNLGGTAGFFAGHEAEQFFGLWGALILLFALILVGIGIVTDIVVLAQAIGNIGAKAGSAVASVRLPGRRAKEDSEEDADDESVEEKRNQPSRISIALRRWYPQAQQFPTLMRNTMRLLFRFLEKIRASQESVISRPMRTSSSVPSRTSVFP